MKRIWYIINYIYNISRKKNIEIERKMKKKKKILNWNHFKKIIKIIKVFSTSNFIYLLSNQYYLIIKLNWNLLKKILQFLQIYHMINDKRIRKIESWLVNANSIINDIMILTIQNNFLSIMQYISSINDLLQRKNNSRRIARKYSLSIHSTHSMTLYPILST